MPDWERVSNDISHCALDTSTILGALKPILWGRVTNVGQLVDNQVDKLRTLETELLEARILIDRYAQEDQKHIQELQDQTQAFKNKLTRQNSEIKDLKSKIKDLERRLDPQPSKPPTPQTPPKQPNDKTPNAPNDSKPVESQDEVTAKALIAEGRKAFDGRQFETAEKNFNQARKFIGKLALEGRRNFNQDEVEYYLAACAAFDPGLELTKKTTKLAEFSNTHRNSKSLRSSQLAHANHLLAQLYVQLGELNSAEEACNNTASFTSRLAADDQRRYEQTALSIRINELKGEDEVLNNAIAQRIPQPWREWFRQRYSFLRPKGSAKQPSNPLRPQPPEGIVPAPTWLVPRLSFKPQKSPIPPVPDTPVPKQDAPAPKSKPKSPEPRRRPISKATRREWLLRLELPVGHDSFREAILDGDLQRIERLVAGLRRGQSPPDVALHIAVLFGEVEIAGVLIRAGSDVDQQCKIARLRKENAQCHSYGVTPMHVAIGAQQQAMIRFLRGNGASFRIPKNTIKNRPMAPARFLLSEGWLTMIDCQDPQEVAQTVDTLMSLKWDINSVLDSDGKTLLEYAEGLDYDVRGFKRAVIKELEARGAE